MSKTLSTVCLALALSSASSAQEILILGGGGDLHSVDLNSGEATFIGASGLTPHFWSGMAINSSGQIFASYGRYFSEYEIYEINPTNGQATFVSQTNLFGLSAMAFDSNDVLYGLNDRTAPLGTRPMDLYTIDLQTGTTTLIGDTGITNSLAMDFHDGSLWCFNPTAGLHKLDQATGIATDVNPAFRGPIGATASMCFNEAGTLYHLDGGVWMVDSQSGTFSLANALTPFGFWAEAVFLEGPSPAFSVWLSGVGGGMVEIKCAGAAPFAQIGIGIAGGAGGPTFIPPGYPCAGISLSLNSNMRPLGTTISDLDGKAEFGPIFIPAGAVDLLHVQAIDLSTCNTSNQVTLSF
jgi:hypothetical protein